MDKGRYNYMAVEYRGEFTKLKNKLGYKGCKNCKYRSKYNNLCKWGKKEIPLILCPRWGKD